MQRPISQALKKTRNCRGAILVFSTFALAVVISMMALATEIFRISAASSQQYDATSLASETAVAAAYKCLHGTSPQPTVSVCQEYARAAALNAVNSSRLAGQARVGTIGVDLYACEMYSDAEYKTKLTSLDANSLTATRSMTCDKVTSTTSMTGRQLRAVNVSLSGAQLPTFFKIFPSAQTKFNRGKAEVMYAPDNSPLANPNLLRTDGSQLPAVHAVRRIKPDPVSGTNGSRWRISVGQ